MRSGGEMIIDYLIEEGIEFVVGIPGHGCLSLFDALRDRVEKGRIRYIQVKQENNAVYLADGYYRASGKIMAVITSIGPGALNTVTGLATAYADSTPVLVLSGDTHTYMRGSGVLQEIERTHDSDFISCVRPVTKRCWRVDNIMQLPNIMQRAFNEMLTGRKGPVAISLPMDIQAQSLDIELPVPYNRRATSLTYGDPAFLHSAYELMKSASRPVILVGGGLLYADCSNDLITLAERWGAAVITTMAGKSAFPEDHPQYGWHGGSKGTDVGNYLCRTSDIILSLGCRFADETASSYRKGVTFDFSQTRLIQVDIDHQQIGKNYPCAVGIVGDVKAVIKQILNEFDHDQNKNSSDNTVFLQDIQKTKDAWLSRLRGFRNSSSGQMTISQFIYEINKVFPDQGTIVTSSGNSQAQIFQEYCFKKTRTHITTGGFSTMGFAYPASLGVKLSLPDKPVMAIIGDGDFMMCLQELSTAVQYNIPVILVMLNNNGWLAIKDLQMDAFGQEYRFGNDFTLNDRSIYMPDYCAVARAFGMESWQITSTQEIESVIRKALTGHAPVFIEVIVNRQYPFSGGIVSGWWDVPVPAYITERSTDYLKSRDQEDLG